MDNGYKSLSNSSCKVVITDVSECFICRDVELATQDPLRKFCDCKNLLVHHRCLLTWIRKGLGSEDRLRCSVCKAEYQLQRRPPWRSVVCRWQTWPILIAATVLGLGLLPYVVYHMMTAFKNPPPHTLFKAAAICFGLLTETLLIKCLWSYFGGRYRQAKQSSFSVQPRRPEEREAGPAPWWTTAAAAPGRRGSLAAVAVGAGERKQEADGAGRLSPGLKQWAPTVTAPPDGRK